MVQAANSQITSCAGPRGESMYYPISCNSSKTPVCASGFRRVLFGSRSSGSGEIEKAFACESTSGETPLEYRRGGLYGYAAVIREGSSFLSCAGPRGEQTYSPIYCGSDNVPRCEAGFRRVSSGVGTAANINQIEQYFTCEAMW